MASTDSDKIAPLAGVVYRPRMQQPSSPTLTRAFRGQTIVRLGATAWCALWLASCGGGTPAAEHPASAPDVTPHSDVTPSPTANDQLATDLRASGTRSAAVDELLRRYATEARNGTQTDSARAFAKSYAAPAAEAYIAAGDELTGKQRLALIQTLVAMSDDAVVGALAHAIERYATSGAGVEEAIYACHGALELHSPTLGAALLDAYKKVDTSDADGLRFSRHLASAMSAQRDDAWTRTFVEELSKPIDRPARFDDKPAVKAFQSGLFRQTIATRLLGESGSQQAVSPVLTLLLDAEKAEVHPAAELAVVRLAKVALPAILELLRGEGELVNLARQARKDESQAHIYFATKWLDLLRLPSTEQDLLDAWRRTKNPVARTLLVRSLARLPGAVSGLDELKTTYLQTDIKVTLPEGESALETLSDAAVQFYDPSVVPWLEDRVGRVPTVWTRRGDVQVALVLAMSRLLNADQLKATSAAAQRYGGKPGTPAYESAAQLVTRCTQNAACYVSAIAGAETPFVALKATTMAGVYGDTSTRDALLDLVVQTDEQELLNQLLSAVEHLTLRDAPAAADKLAQLAKPELEATSPTWPRGKRAAIAATIARLRAR